MNDNKIWCCKLASLAFVLMWLIATPICAQRANTKNVHKDYTFYAGNNMSIQQAKQKALECAQLEAIADEFGTIISNTTVMHQANSLSGENSQSSTHFLSLGSSDVRGEWVRDLSEPIFTTDFDDNLGMIVRVKVHGEIRERVRADIPIKVLTLRNGTTERYKSTSFLDDDELYMLFQSPIDGYLVVYLTDEESAYCLLPYQNQAENTMPIKKNEEYVFFSIDKAKSALKPFVDEYHLTCQSQMELNRIYVIFSPQEFVKAIDNTGENNIPRNLSLKDFHLWLGKIRSHDTGITCSAIDIDIQPK